MSACDIKYNLGFQTLRNFCKLKSPLKLFNVSSSYAETSFKKLTSETVELELPVSSFQNKLYHSTGSTTFITTVSPINVALGVRSQTIKAMYFIPSITTATTEKDCMQAPAVSLGRTESYTDITESWSLTPQVGIPFTSPLGLTSRIYKD